MAYTNFHNYSHAQLRKMVQSLNSGEVMAASDPWRRATQTLKQIRATLTRASTEAAGTWEGATSDAFHSRMLHLANTINNAASYSNDAANTLKALAEAIDQAKREMPEEPGNWEKFKDGFGDTVSSTFGGDDEDTKTNVADERRAEAVAVMQTLALKYRTATPMLKPVADLPTPLKWRGDEREVPGSAPDSSGTAALGSLMAGTSPITAGMAPRPTSAPTVPAPKPVVPTSKRPAPLPPTDSGIKGGTAQATPKPPTVSNVGPGTGIDSATVTNPNPSGGGAQAPNNSGHSNATNQSGTTGISNPGGQGQPNGVRGPSDRPSVAAPQKSSGGGQQSKGPVVGGQGHIAPAAPRGGGNTFGPGGMPGGGLPGGSGPAGGKVGSGSGRRVGHAVGEGDHAPAGSGGKRAFTEGGSGIGARNRVRGEMGGSGAAAGFGPAMPVAGSQRRKDEKEREGKRPDYLVEDEETWASDKPRNPNVVE
ncbi:PPE domain-containing protein [Kitasatospora sp. NPDC054939]